MTPPDKTPALEIRGLEKTYQNGFQALKTVDLTIQTGEIFALLGPNGAGKTTLINAVCGIVRPSAGQIQVCGFDHVTHYRNTRDLIGLVPQEITTDAFETVWNTVRFSRGLFGKPRNDAYIETLLKRLSLWDKKDNQLRMLSGGMKRRVMIAKALSHEPQVLFLDEPTAGVDVTLRSSMWDQVRELRETGVTIILTTHYIEEAEEMADRIGVINHGELILTENKKSLMKKLGKKELVIDLAQPLTELPASLAGKPIQLLQDGQQLVYTYDTLQENNGVAELMDELKTQHIRFKDISTQQSSLEEIFVQLVGQA
ncbi:MAG: ABC transporter ATP-binding protein [Acidobacteria bacterium]|nr:ABC transporter ATP-binding protein [Acidobacteriota bacterium]MCB9399526.1 ABC transporter ATP-binding protein [Acidobacteriota bacterium]